MLGIKGAGIKHGPYLVESKETNYQLVRIYRAPTENKTGGNRPSATLLLTEAGFGMQSMWVEGQSYTESWQDLFAIVPRICGCSTSDPKAIAGSRTWGSVRSGP